MQRPGTKNGEPDPEITYRLSDAVRIATVDARSQILLALELAQLGLLGILVTVLVMRGGG